MIARLKSKRFIIGLTVSLSVLAPFFLYSAYLGRSNAAYVDSLCADRACACGDWYRRSVGEYQIENNVWNKGNITTYRQCVFIEDGGSGIDAGWAWNWPGIRFDVVAYPNIIYGKSPWLPSTSSRLPIRISEIGCLEADFEIVQEGSSKGNLAFDLWLTSSASSQPSDVTREVMIWISRTGFWSAGSRVDTIDVDGLEVGVWKKENHQPSPEYAWTYVAFVYQSDLAEGPVDLLGFLDYLVDNGHVSPDEYLSAIQLGNEIVSGYGQTLISRYEILLCDE